MEFSQKQKKAITWWRQSEKQAVICDGAVRSGKTLAIGLGFFLWATASFQGRQFALCGKTAGAVRHAGGGSGGEEKYLFPVRRTG